MAARGRSRGRSAPAAAAGAPAPAPVGAAPRGRGRSRGVYQVAVHGFDLVLSIITVYNPCTSKNVSYQLNYYTIILQESQ